MSSHVNRELVLEYYNKVLAANPDAILKDVVQAMADDGLKNPATGQPWSHSTIHYALQRFPEAQKAKGQNTTKIRPIVVRMVLFPLISKWLEENISNAEVIDEKDLTVEKVAGRRLYGYGSPAVLLACAKVWWPFIPRKGAVSEDMELDGSIRFHSLEMIKKF
jgi:hypothetical protein